MADSGTSSDEDTMEDKMSELIEVATSTNSGISTDLEKVRNPYMSVVNVL